LLEQTNKLVIEALEHLEQRPTAGQWNRVQQQVTIGSAADLDPVCF